MKNNKIRYKLFFLTIALLSCLIVEAQSGAARYHVIIDTDGAADDLRAICMLLGNKEIEILGITSSEGALLPDRTAVKVASLLNRFCRHDISVAAGRIVSASVPPWRKVSEGIDWGNESNVELSNLSAKELIIEKLEEADDKITIICLGALTNIYDALSDQPQLKERIDKIVWYSSRTNPLSGPNYDTDKFSADRILESGVTVEIVSANEQYPIAVDNSFLDLIATIDTPYAQKIVETHTNQPLIPLVESQHLKIWDELIVAYLFAPYLFDKKQISESVTANTLSDEEINLKVKEQILTILKGNFVK